MNSTIVPCALRTHRRTWGFSQRELAELLGFRSATPISRLEHGKRVPAIEIALACATLFSVSLGELFPQLTMETEDNLRKRVSRFQQGLSQPTSISQLRKRELLSRALSAESADGRDPSSV
jgi:transcriptional regulator with XRE-family HTH domain